MLLPRFPGASLKTRVTVLVAVVVLLTTLILTTAALALVERGMQSVIGDQQVARLSGAVRTLDEQLATKQLLLAVLAEDLPPAARSDAAALREFLRGRTHVRAQFSNIAVLDSKGQMVASLREGSSSLPQRSFSQRQYFIETMRSGRGLITAPFRSALSGRPVLLITQPVTGADGAITFILTAAIDLDGSNMFDEIAAAGPDKNGFMFIMSTAGIVISHPDRKRVLQHINAKPGRNSAIDQALAGFEGWVEAANQEGSVGIYSFKRLTRTDWIVASRYPHDEAFAPIRAMRQRVLLAAVLFAVLAGVSCWMAVRAVLAPLELLRTQALKVRDGILDSRELQGGGEGEIGELRQAIYALVSAREAAQAASDASERRARTIADAMPALIAYIDRDGIYRFTNEQYRLVFRIDPASMLGRQASEVLDRAITALLRDPIARALAGQRVEEEVEAEGAHYLVHLIPDTTADGSVLGCYAMLTDISERKRAEMRQAASEQQAEAASQAKTEFVANISHEIRTPLNAVLGINHLLSKTRLAPEQREYVELVQASGAALLNILNDVLDFSKIEAGKLELDVAPFQLYEVLDNVATIMVVQAGDKPLTLTIEVDASVPGRLTGDAVRLQQVLVNLVSNAVKFTPAGAVSLSVALLGLEHGQASLGITVRDSGIGMSEQQQARLFTPFMQADASHTRRYGGTGLGLAICRRLTELMTGTLEVESTLGLGSTFRLQLQLAVASPPVLLPAAGARMLVASANPGHRAYLAWLAAQCGVQADTAASIEQACVDAGPGPGAGVDWIVVDWQLGGREGVRKAAAAFPQARLIVLVDPAERSRVDGDGMAPGSAGYLLAPPRGKELMALLATETSPVVQGRAALLDGVPVLLVGDSPLNQFVARCILEQSGASVDVCAGFAQAQARAAPPGGFSLVLVGDQMSGPAGPGHGRRLRSRMGTAALLVVMSAGLTDAERTALRAAGIDDFIGKPLEMEELQACLSRHAPTVQGAAQEGQFDVRALIAGQDSEQRQMMIEIIARVVDALPADLESIRAAIASGAVLEAKGVLHRLRGSVGTLGARHFVEAALALEALLGHASASVPAALDRVAHELEQTRQRAKAWLEEHRSGPSRIEEDAEAKEGMQELKAMLAAHDLDACALVHAMRPELERVLGPQALELLEQHVRALAFAPALALLHGAGQ